MLKTSLKEVELNQAKISENLVKEIRTWPGDGLLSPYTEIDVDVLSSPPLREVEGGVDNRACSGHGSSSPS